jgi:hypothetical protein
MTLTCFIDFVELRFTNNLFRCPIICKIQSSSITNSPLNYCYYLSMNCLQIAMCFYQQTDYYQHHSIYLKSYILIDR